MPPPSVLPAPISEPIVRHGSLPSTSLDGTRVFSRWRAVVSWRLRGLMAWSGRGGMAVINLAIVVAFLTALRTVLLIVSPDVHQLSLGHLVRLYLVGWQYDLLVGLCFGLPQVLHITLVGDGRIHRPLSRVLLESTWLIGLTFLPFLVVLEYLFFEEFQSRLNYIAFEYIVYPTEVCCNIWESYPVGWLLTGVGAVGGGMWWGLRQPYLKLVALPFPWKRRWGCLAAWLTAIGVLWASTSEQTREISGNRVAKECAWNGLYSFVAYAWSCRTDFHVNYVTVDQAEAFARLRREIVQPADQGQPESSNPVDRIVAAGENARDWNVVLIVEESFGSDFVGALGDSRGLTPHFDALCREGLLFENFYATGNRTARALEAVLTSMPPIPTEAILKRDHSQRVYTLAHVLAERGYERLFITGGRGLFDGVRSFMTANGFNRFLEQSDIEKPVFVNAWGVSDEDLFRRAIAELDQLAALGKPFLATLLTVSNHRPFTFPAGRIPETAQTRENAVKYADWALGWFFREAKSRPFYRNTLFVILGDHGARVYGRQYFPMKSYRVPVLLISPDGDLRGQRCSTLGCLMDVAPTILGRLGGEYRSVFFGHDVLATPPDAGRAVMQHNHDVALLDGRHHMVVLGYNRKVSGFELDPTTFELRSVRKLDPELLRNATVFFQTAHDLYYANRWFPQIDHPERELRPE